ncbi:MAG: hypothetical protein WBA93_17345 [Microcoleaceae cyanobacterium]
MWGEIDRTEVELHGYFHVITSSDSDIIVEAYDIILESGHKHAQAVATFYDKKLATKTANQLNAALRGLNHSRDSFIFFGKRKLEPIE